MRFNNFFSHHIGQKPLCVCFYMVLVLLCCSFALFCFICRATLVLSSCISDGESGPEIV